MINAILGGVDGILDKFIGDKDKKRELNAALSSHIIQHSSDIAKAQASIILAEATGKSWMQRNARPSLMFMFIGILFNNYIFRPYAVAFGLDVPQLDMSPSFWGLFTVCIGGYITSRGYEKTKGLNIQQATLESTLK